MPCKHKYDNCPVCNSVKQVQSKTCRKCMWLKKQTLNIKCSFCGKSFYRAPSKIGATTKRNPLAKFYCNKSCKAKFEFKKKTIFLTCGTCGEEMTRSPSGVSENNFCSRRCTGLWLRQFTGKEARHWKGGYNKDERTKIRSRIAWKELRILILEKFMNKCAWCNKVDDSLHLHHLIPWRLGGKDEISNLIPLCSTCHSKQTVLDWQDEHGRDWKTYGAHTFKERDVHDGACL